MISDGVGKFKGYAYIEFETEEEAKAGLSLNRTELDCRTIQVRVSKPPAKKQIAEPTPVSMDVDEKETATEAHPKLFLTYLFLIVVGPLLYQEQSNFRKASP